MYMSMETLIQIIILIAVALIGLNVGLRVIHLIASFFDNER